MYYEFRDRDSYYAEPGNIQEYPILPRKVSFILGRRISAPLPTPLRFAMHPTWGRDLLLFLGSQVPVMRKDLIAALREVGVDNIDTYDAIIYDPYNSRDVLDYQAVNIIGVVAAADLATSDYESFGETPNIDAIFAGPVIDDRRTAGALMFRMKESVTTVMVHERVKQHVGPRFPSLLFIPAVNQGDDKGIDDEGEEEED